MRFGVGALEQGLDLAHPRVGHVDDQQVLPVGDGLLDSFDLVTLVAEIDRAFSLSVPGTDILPENFQNLAAITALLRRLGTA